MSKYLTEEQLKFNIGYGRAVEQWLGFEEEQESTILKWLRIDKERNEMFSVTYFESFDEGSHEFLDMYEFSMVDPDEPFGVINTFSSISDALTFASLAYNAAEDKFVSSGMIQEEYRVYLNR